MSTHAAPSRAVPTAAASASEAPDPRGLVLLVAGYAACLVLLAVHVDRAFGLPAHPLLIHVPVVLIPVLSLASIAVAVRPVWRERFGLAWALLALVALGGTVLAAGAGSELLGRFGGAKPGTDLAEHAELADTLKLVMFVFAAVVVAVVAAGRRLRGRAPSLLAGAALVVLALVAAYYVVRVGDLGARATWSRG